MDISVSQNEETEFFREYLIFIRIRRALRAEKDFETWTSKTKTCQRLFIEEETCIVTKKKIQ